MLFDKPGVEVERQFFSLKYTHFKEHECGIMSYLSFKKYSNNSFKMTKKLQSELKGLMSYCFGSVVGMLIIGTSIL